MLGVHHGLAILREAKDYAVGPGRYEKPRKRAKKKEPLSANQKKASRLISMLHNMKAGWKMDPKRRDEEGFMASKEEVGAVCPRPRVLH